MFVIGFEILINYLIEFSVEINLVLAVLNFSLIKFAPLLLI